MSSTRTKSRSYPNNKGGCSGGSVRFIISLSFVRILLMSFNHDLSLSLKFASYSARCIFFFCLKQILLQDDGVSTHLCTAAVSFSVKLRRVILKMVSFFLKVSHSSSNGQDHNQRGTTSSRQCVTFGDDEEWKAHMMHGISR